jgi:hypothetical protein
MLVSSKGFGAQAEETEVTVIRLGVNRCGVWGVNRCGDGHLKTRENRGEDSGCRA